MVRRVRVWVPDELPRVGEIRVLVGYHGPRERRFEYSLVPMAYTVPGRSPRVRGWLGVDNGIYKEAQGLWKVVGATWVDYGERMALVTLRPARQEEAIEYIEKFLEAKPRLCTSKPRLLKEAVA